MIGSGFLSWVGLTWSALMTGIASFALFFSQNEFLLNEERVQRFYSYEKGDTTMFLLPGVGGWLMTGQGVMFNALTFISLFLPIFGE